MHTNSHTCLHVPDPLHVLPTCALQVSLKAVAEAVGQVEQVHFLLFGSDTVAVFLEAARQQFGAPLQAEL
jgi:hypothetical protein